MILHPEIDPNIFVIGPIPLIDKSLPVRWYGVMYLVGFAIALLLGRYRANKPNSGWNYDQISDLIFFSAIGLIVGARVGYVLFYKLNDFLVGLFTWSDPALLFKVNEGGMSFHGGLLGVMCGIAYFCHKYNKNFLDVADFTVPLTPLGIFFGRMGNFINGELWGRMTDTPWCMVFRDWYANSNCIQQVAGGCKNITQAIIDTKTHCAVLEHPLKIKIPANIPMNHPVRSNLPPNQDYIETCMGTCRHPSQLYEGMLEGLVLFGFIWWFSRKPRPRMAVSGAFLTGYGIFRFSIEFFRQPDSHLNFIAFDWLTMGQILSTPMVIAGILLLYFAYSRQPVPSKKKA